MKKLLLLFFSLLAFGYMFQACDNSKTYAEMLDEEKDAVNAFIKKHNIQTISESDFEANGYKTDTTKNEYVAFSNGVYMQIVDKGIVTDKPENDSIKNNNIVAVRFVEHDIKANDTTCFNVVLPGFENYPNYYTYPDVFRYVDNGTSGRCIYRGVDVCQIWYDGCSSRMAACFKVCYQLCPCENDCTFEDGTSECKPICKPLFLRYS